MLLKRLIIVLTFDNGVLVRTKNFHADYRYTLNFVDAWSIDEIVVLDITRPGQGERVNFYDVVSRFADQCFVPLTAGGGVHAMEDFKTILELGADKVIVNSEAVSRPDFISQAAGLYGSQCVVISMDVKRNENCEYEVFTECGTRPTGLSPVLWAKQVQALGAGEILVTSIEKDGSLEGYDNHLNRLVAEAVTIPVLVCGGAGKWQDFVEGFSQGKAAGVCTTNIYHFTENSIISAKTYLKENGIQIR